MDPNTHGTTRQLGLQPIGIASIVALGVAVIDAYVTDVQTWAPAPTWDPQTRAITALQGTIGFSEQVDDDRNRHRLPRMPVACYYSAIG